MALDPLAFRLSIAIPDLPRRWLPFTSLYDADLPGFPTVYFHALLPCPAGVRAGDSDRVFGYVETLAPTASGGFEAVVVTNKDLTKGATARGLVEREVRERLGVGNPVTVSDVSSAFRAPHEAANGVLKEIWQRVVTQTYDNQLPFGRLWDPILGLARFVASFNSPSGRKGELIQTAYFTSHFGEPVQSAADLLRQDFFLLPTVEEVRDQSNPLLTFPRFRRLLDMASDFARLHFTDVSVGAQTLSAYRRTPKTGPLNTSAFKHLVMSLAPPSRGAATEVLNTFDKGPPRAILFILMLADLRAGRLRPEAISGSEWGALYGGLARTYQSPKVMAIYAQQCFGNIDAMPIDTWVEAFLKYPLSVWPRGGRAPRAHVFGAGSTLGKVERLIWTAAQARKVHSIACNDALWCIKHDERRDRGPNPLSCNACLDPIRRACPAYALIAARPVSFNASRPSNGFSVITSAGNNYSPGQCFLRCEGFGSYGDVSDAATPSDASAAFHSFPDPSHLGHQLTVEEFVARY